MARAKKAALDVLSSLGIEAAHQIDVQQIAMQRGTIVMPQPYRGLDGSLIRSGKLGLIGYRQDIREPGRIAFTIAHELGHWELHPNHSQAVACTSGDIAAYRGSGTEQEANAFAAELLMPTPLLVEALRFASPTVQKVGEVAQTFRTSLTAAAIRVVELIDFPALVVLSANNRVTWSIASSKARSYYFVQRGDPIDSRALAWNCLTEIDELDEPEEVKPFAWFSRDRDAHRLQVWEQSVVLGDYDVVLSMVSFDER